MAPTKTKPTALYHGNLTQPPALAATPSRPVKGVKKRAATKKQSASMAAFKSGSKGVHKRPLTSKAPTVVAPTKPAKPVKKVRSTKQKPQAFYPYGRRNQSAIMAAPTKSEQAARKGPAPGKTAATRFPVKHSKTTAIAAARKRSSKPFTKSSFKTSSKHVKAVANSLLSKKPAVVKRSAKPTKATSYKPRIGKKPAAPVWAPVARIGTESNLVQNITKAMVAARNAPKKTVRERSPPFKQQTISFLDLPPEIRNMIYDHVHNFAPLKYVPSLDSSAKSIERLHTVHPDSARQPARMPILLGLCKQIRAEFVPWLLRSTAIAFTVVDFDFRYLTRFLKHLTRPELESLKANPDVSIVIVGVGKPGMDRLYNWIRFLATDDGVKGHQWAYKRPEHGWEVQHHFVNNYGACLSTPVLMSPPVGVAEMKRLHEVMFNKDMKEVLGDFIKAYSGEVVSRRTGQQLAG